MATVITNAGQAIPSGRMIGATPSQAEPKFIGWGTTVHTAVVGDTAISGEKALDLSSTSGTRTTGTSSQVTTTQTNDTYQVTGTLTATGSGTVVGAGLLDNATIGSGTLYVYGDFTGIALVSGDSIAFTIKVKFA
jgi:hypothetical protein